MPPPRDSRWFAGRALATLRQPFGTAVVVGTALSLINHPELLAGRLNQSVALLLMNFFVPFAVALYSRWALSRELADSPRPGSLALALPGLLLSLNPASAQEKESFNEDRFEALQAGGALILVDVYADWCPTCAEQQEILAAFREQHPDTPLHVLTVDFDKQKKWVRHFKAPRQSTFVLFKGGEQVWFAVAETRQEEVFKQILSAADQG